MVRAEIFSYDDVHVVHFDVESWLEQASDDELLDLADDGWRYWGEYQSSLIPWAENKYPQVAELMKYCDEKRIEYECIIDDLDAEAWIDDNHPDLAAPKETDFAGWWSEPRQPQPEEPVTPFVKNSTTLVIHPTDSSTTFLNIIYAGKGFDVLNSYRGDLNVLLPQYERAIMLGHGWTGGLFSVGQFKGSLFGMAIDSTSLPGLQGKDNVYIWCKASDFVQKFGLKGFSTGMFISEVAEARMFNITTTQEAIDYSNNLFANIMHKYIEQPNLQTIIEEYNGDCPVIQYNRSVMRQF